MFVRRVTFTWTVVGGEGFKKFTRQTIVAHLFKSVVYKLFTGNCVKLRSAFILSSFNTWRKKQCCDMAKFSAAQSTANIPFTFLSSEWTIALVLARFLLVVHWFVSFVHAFETWAGADSLFEVSAPTKTPLLSQNHNTRSSTSPAASTLVSWRRLTKKKTTFRRRSKLNVLAERQAKLKIQLTNWDFCFTLFHYTCSLPLLRFLCS